MKKLFLVVLIAGSALVMGGCFKVDSNFTEVRDVVLSEVDSSFGDVVEIHLGGFPLSVAGIALRFVDEPEAKEALQYVGRIDSVEVGVYELLDSAQTAQVKSGLKGRLDVVFSDQGFERMLTHREQGEWVSIYASLPGSESDAVRELFVVVIDSRECVLVRLGGDLSEMVRAAAREHLKDVEWRELLEG